jgi:hypothetical protein
LGIVPPSVVIVADMTWLMQVLDAVEQEPQREPSLLDRLGLVADHLPELVDLVHDTAVFRVIGGPLRIVLRLI